MPTLTIPRNYSDGTTLTEAQLDAAFDAVETMINTTGLSTDNLQASSVDTSELAASSVTAAKIATDAVTTVKIQDAAVTRAKLAALGHQLSSSSGTFSTTATGLTDVTNLTVSITTTGRPVMLMLVPDGTLYSALYKSTDSASIYLALDRGGSTIQAVQSPGTTVTGVSIAPTVWVDVPAAGTYTYKIRCAVETSGTLYVYYWKLLAFEL